MSALTPAYVCVSDPEAALTDIRECAYCGVRSAILPRECCTEGWLFDALYAICAPFYDALEGRFVNTQRLQWLLDSLKHQMQNFCDEHDIDVDGEITCNWGLLCVLNLRPRSLSPPSYSSWLPDETRRRMIWNDVIATRSGSLGISHADGAENAIVPALTADT